MVTVDKIYSLQTSVYSTRRIVVKKPETRDHITHRAGEFPTFFGSIWFRKYFSELFLKLLRLITHNKLSGVIFLHQIKNKTTF